MSTARYHYAILWPYGVNVTTGGCDSNVTVHSTGFLYRFKDQTDRYLWCDAYLGDTSTKRKACTRKEAEALGIFSGDWEDAEQDALTDVHCACANYNKDSQAY